MACLDENQVLALAHGRLEGDALRTAQRHLDGCADCLDLVGFYQQSAQEAANEEETHDHDFVVLSDSEEMDLKAPEGSKIGRYEVIHALGRGGMGVVYLALDPKLGRRVALKLVKPSLHSDERAEHFEKRLMREARAMASLAHPNVLTIFDVGIEEGQVFLASEWVDGCTLDEWMSQGPHRWSAIALRFREAARGLVAAHAAGLVHRDFKPSNVMVGKDERVRVFDFGLVKATTANIGDITTQLSGNFVVGTPAYMAPEQMIGKEADERSDQFSFCASMYEALAGVRPFQGRNLTELLRNIGAGKIEEPKKIPKWLWELLRRGLNKKPEERHESMASILKILDAHLGHRRRRSLMAAVAALALGAGAVTATSMWRDYAAGSDKCGNLQVQLGEAWSAQRRLAVEEAITSSDLPFAAKSWERSGPLLDSYAEDWKAEVHSACIETHITRQQSQVILRRRNDCFERLRSELDYVTGELARGKPEGITAAVSLVQALAPTASCSAAQGAGEFVSQEDSEANERVRKLWPLVVEVESLVTMGDSSASLAKSEALLAEEVPSRRLEARLWKSRGQALRLGGNYQEAVSALESSFYAAVAGRHDEMAALATTQLYSILNVHLKDDERAQRWQQLAASTVERVRSPLAYGDWRRAQGKVALAKNDFAGAEGHFQASLEIFERALGPEHEEVARALGFLARCQTKMQDSESALASHERAIARWTELVGDSHPDTASARIDLATLLAKQGKSGEARTMVEAAVRAMVIALGEDNLRVAWALNSMANHSVADGDFAAASTALLRALRIKRSLHGNTHASLVSTLTNLMEVDRMLTRHGDAIIHGDEALQILLQDTSATSSVSVKRLKIAIAEARLSNGDAEGAMADCRLLQRDVDESKGSATASATYEGRVLSCLARASLQLGRAAEGRKMLDKAIARFGSEGARHRLATALFAKARLAKSDEGLSDAKRSRDYFAESGPAWASESKAVEEWLLAQSESP